MNVRNALPMLMAGGVLGTALIATPGAAPPAPANTYPAWSPDGTRIAFQSNRTGDVELFVMNADGTHVTQLTDNPGRDAHPSWSPDGRRLVFSSVRNASSSTAGRMYLYTMDADGGRQAPLTSAADSSGEDSMPDWSPDGSRVVFLSDRTGKREAWVIGLADGKSSPLTSPIRRPHGEVGNPHWSRDAAAVLFDANYDYTYDLFSIRPDGTGLTKLTQAPQSSGDLFFASVVPGSGALSYGRQINKQWKIVVGQTASNQPAPLFASSSGNDFWQSWSPDGKRFVFSSDRGGALDLYTANADGSGVVQLTHGHQ